MVLHTELRLAITLKYKLAVLVSVYEGIVRR